MMARMVAGACREAVWPDQRARGAVRSGITLSPSVRRIPRRPRQACAAGVAVAIYRTLWDGSFPVGGPLLCAEVYT